MLLSLILTTIPTIIFYTLIDKSHILKSKYLQIAISWFIGQYISLLIILSLSIIFSSLSTTVLNKITISYIFLLIFSLYLLQKKHFITKLKSKKTMNIFSRIFSLDSLYILFCIVFSYFLYIPHLLQTNNAIYISPIYWDFNIHFPIIQNFVYGNNFPPQNESFANFPMSYHYYFDLFTSIYSSIGLNLSDAINFSSIITFFFMLIAIIGFTQELFKSKIAGFLAVLLTISSSSLHFLNYFFFTHKSFFENLNNMFTNTQHPYFFSLVQGDPFGYNGNMFNIFYFVAERQMVFGILFLISSVTFLYYRRFSSDILSLFIGIFIGLFFYGHLFILIMIATASCFLLIFDKNKKKTLLMLVGFAISFIPNYIYFKSLMKPEFFNSDINNFPKVNFNFPTMPGSYTFSVIHDLGYYFYAYGIKIPFIFVGFFVFWKKNKKLLILFLSIILPTFLFINLIQISPISIYDNHKWLKPMNVFLDIIVGYILYIILIKNNFFKIAGIICFVILTLSGFLELIPFLNSKPTNFYANYQSTFIEAIRNNSKPKSVFLSRHVKELHLAGRRLYLGSSHDEPGATSVIDSFGFNKTRREDISRKIYSVKTYEEFCNLAKIHNIHYIEDSQNILNKVEKKFKNFPYIQTTDELGVNVLFLDINKGC